MSWSKDWTVAEVEQNYKVIGIVDPDDIEQLIKDSKELAALKDANKVNSEEGYEFNIDKLC